MDRIPEQSPEEFEAEFGPEFAELTAPPVVFPDQTTPESAYRVAHDLLVRRAPVEALGVVEPALAEDPRNTGLRSLRAWAFLLQARLGRAEEELRALVAADPTDVWAVHALGRALERQSRYADALPHLRLAAAMTGDPVHVAAAERVGGRLNAPTGDQGGGPASGRP